MALTNYEVLYLGRDNSINLQLWADSSATDLASVTECRLRVGSAVITSTDAAAGDIRWAQAGYETGEIRVYASTMLSTGDYRGALVVFDPTNSTGLVWDDNIPLRIKSDPLST